MWFLDFLDRIFEAIKKFCTDWKENETSSSTTSDIENYQESNENSSLEENENESNTEMETQNQNNNTVINFNGNVQSNQNKSYFTIEELCKSETAKQKGIDNTPSPEVKFCLTKLIDNVLNPLREKFGKPITVTSGYRSVRLNTAVGGSKTSQHVKGQAADIVYSANLAENKTIFDILRKMEVDQAIWEKGNDMYPAWVHVSWNPNGYNRKQYLRTRDGKTYFRI